MPPNSSEGLEDTHNQGQADAVAGEYNLRVPLGPLTELTTPEKC
jgi:hypothetical protein